MRDKNQTYFSPHCIVCRAYLNSASMIRIGEACLIRCEICGSWTYFPRLSDREQETLHDNAEYFEHPYFVVRRQAKRSIELRCRHVFQRISTIVDLESLRGKRLLDIGCDTGGFLSSAANQFGIKPVGIDVSRQAVQVTVSQGIEAYHTNIEHAPEHLKGFQMITAIDLIEHAISPELFLRQVFPRLQPGGIIYLETPNILSCVYQTGRILCYITGGKPQDIFKRLFPPEHVQYFTRQSLSLLGQRCGFDVVRLHSRSLPFRDISASLFIRLGVSLLQLPDILTKNKILLWGIFRRS